MASIKLRGDTSGELVIEAPAVAGTNTLTLPASTSTLATTAQTEAIYNSLGVRNRIINGDMRIDQRNAGASVTANNNIYGADRFKVSTGYTSKATIQQSTTVPAGFKNSIIITSSAATSTASGDYMTLIQAVEGLNVTDLGWGAARASTVTLSFWVRSSVTGTYGGSINNSGNARSYVFSYTISSANTWEQKTVTIPGDTSGTWLTTNGIGMLVRFSIAMGSTYTNTSGSWYSGDYEGATGQVNLLNTNGATFYITGVQLEVGTEATPFEHRPYDMELARCQRYYIKYGSDSSDDGIGITSANATTNAICMLFYPVKMRASPTVSFSGLKLGDGVAGPSTVTAITENKSNTMTSNVGLTSSGLTQYRPYIIRTNTITSYLDFSAEL